MLVINEYTNILGHNTIEFSCPFCSKSLQWSSGQMSPFNCYACMKPMVDITKIMEQLAWRIIYHKEEDGYSRCAYSNVDGI